jgi:non-heme chloroperoxidase
MSAFECKADKIYEKFPHGMCTTHADVVNPELLAFIAE